MVAVSQAKSGMIPNAILGMIFFIGTEVMLFAGLISSYMVIRAGEAVWPPFGQPRLPIEATAFNTAVLLLSGLLLFKAGRDYASPFTKIKAHRLLTISMGLGVFFVLFQGFEWVRMIGFGLTMNSSLFGSIFYLIIGMHATHAIGGLCALVYVWAQTHPEKKVGLSPDAFAAGRLFWYFVVGIWPILYVIVYLL